MEHVHCTRAAAALSLLLACAAGEEESDTTAGSTGVTTNTATTSGTSDTAGTASTTAGTDSDATSSETTAVTTQDPTTDPTDPTDPTDSTDSTSPGCGLCDEPNQQCVDDVCVTSCQGQDPDPCGPAQVCDVISGECVDANAPCSLAGPAESCGDASCGPGTVCDGVDACIPIAPCNFMECTGDGACWGTACSCERKVTCEEATAELLNGPFSSDISGIDFADDCNAWSVTLSGGQEFLRKLTPAGDLTTWGGIGDYDQGEVRVLRQLTIPQAKGSTETLTSAPAPAHVEGLGEVALTYVCCPTCGDCNNNPLARGVARLDEENPMMPLPIVIFAEATQGMGPFENKWLDGGPQGLTWGEDRVLYVGNTTANGDYNSANLDTNELTVEYAFAARVTASAPVSAVHILVAIIGGGLYRFNTVTKQADFAVDLMSDVTSLSHDPFTGHVYASLASLEVVRVEPFTGEVEPFATMPGKGRVA
ncbi:MAG: hypothetical protein KC636_35870, partial [Myxococcales bacterium]|nr:hypothetical protein [Myxococcales bacterium]